MDERSNRIEKYLEKVNSFVACLKSTDWITQSGKEAVHAVMTSAIDIQKTLLKDETRKLSDTLSLIYPEYDLTRCVDLVIETIMMHSEWNQKVLSCAFRMYVREFGENKLFDAIVNFLEVKKLREKAMVLILRLDPKQGKKLLKAKSVTCLWEEMIAESNENIESSIKDAILNETSSIDNYLKLTCPSMRHIVLSIIIKNLNNDSNFKLWLKLLSKDNVKTCVCMCNEYPEFLESLLKFFARYASEAVCEDGSLTWTHTKYPVDEFVDILKSLLSCDERVSVSINDFISGEISSFNDNFSFWIDVQSSLS